MEWVETTGKTLDEAKEAALDQLGVTSDDAEFDVVEEARSGLFGRVRQEARVRARVRPTAPPSKGDRRARRPSPSEAPARGAVAPEAPEAKDAKKRPSRSASDDARQKGDESSVTPARGRRSESVGAVPSGEVAADVMGDGSGEPVRGGAGRGRGRRAEQAAADADAAPTTGVDVDDEPSVADQQDTVRDFLDGLVQAFQASATIEVEQVDDETLEAHVVGDDLGLMIGPKGTTLEAVQEIARTVVQRAAEPARGARLRVDIGGYRKHRREALGRFTRQICEQVQASGEPVALEAMTSPDRKVVHDTVNDIAGVASTSEGVDPNRRVIISTE